MTRQLSIAIMALCVCSGCRLLERVGKDEPKVQWRTGSHVITAEKPSDWRWRLQTKEVNMQRPNGEPERMLAHFDLGNGTYYVYLMVGGRDGVRHRAKGGTNYDHRVSSYIHAPIPKGEATWEWTCQDGEITLEIDGQKCRKYPLAVPGARLRKITISHDAGRPAGCKWIAGEVEEL